MVPVLILLVVAGAVWGQPVDSLWSRTFGGAGYDYCYSVQQTSVGGYILGGSTSSFGAGSWDMYLVKTGAQGNQQWTRTFGGAGSDWCNSLQQTTDGGYILGGWTHSFGAGYADMYLVKTDAQGNQQWTRTFGGASDDYCYFVQQTIDGGYILGGPTDSFGAGGSDMYLVKTDAQGNQQWSRTFGGTSSEYCHSVQQTSDGGYILGGFTSSFGAGFSDMYLVKTDAQGNQQWARTFGGASHDECLSVQQTADGGYILGGHTQSFGAGSGDMYLVKTDANGNQQWSRTFGGAGYEYGNSVQETSDGGYVLGGTTRSFGAGWDDMYLVKSDAQGNQQWSRTFGGTGWEECHSVQETDDGGYTLGGYTESFGAGIWDMWLVKTTPDPLFAPQPLRLTSPNGGEQWPLFSMQTITWVSDSVDGLVRIELNRNYPDGTWEILADNSPDDNQEQVTVAGPLSNACRVRISLIGDTLSDVSNGSFSIISPLRITAPNGGEEWPLFSMQTITWVSDGVDGLVRLELNRDYPDGNWELLVDNSPDDNSEEIFISGNASTACRVRISLIGDTLSDVSNGNFSIIGSSGVLRLVRVTQPNSPVNFWYAGSLEGLDTLSESFRLKNFGDQPITVLPPSQPTTAEFSVVSSCDTFNLPPGVVSQCAVTLRYHPQDGGQHRDTLRIATNASNQVDGYVRIPLEGELVLSAGETVSVPTQFALHPVYPNPFNAATTIRYDLPVATQVSLVVYDVLGKEVAVLADGMQSAGRYTLRFDAALLGSGLYFCRLHAGSYAATQKLMLVR